MEEAIEVGWYHNRTQAEIARNLLEAFGIEGGIYSDDLGGVGPGQAYIRGVKLFVDSKDEEEARQILHAREKS